MSNDRNGSRTTDFDHPRHVGYTSGRDRNCDLPAGRFVPAADIARVNIHSLNPSI
jgi:hypothetical protein